MAVEVTFELRLEERRNDRVYVAVLLAPAAAPVTIDGVAVQLFHGEGEPVGPRLLLPISGVLTQPMVTTVELRAHDGVLPTGSQVVGHVWGADGHREATCPADMWTMLETHVRGTHVVHGRNTGELRPLRPAERARLAALFPWTARPTVIPFDGVLEPEEDADGDSEDLDALCAEYGLCGDDAEFLKELLTED